MGKKESRADVKYLYKNGIQIKQIHDVVVKTVRILFSPLFYREEVGCWFKRGRESIDDVARTGRPKLLPPMPRRRDSSYGDEW